MKRIIVIVAAGLIAAASLSAQAIGPRQNFAPGTANAAVTQEVVKVEGKLSLINGMIGIKDKDKTYYVGGLNRLIGFVDGLKEGATVKLEGYAVAVAGAPEYLHFRATKMTFAGKDYDLSQTMGRGGMMGAGPQGGGMMGGKGGAGGRGGMMDGGRGGRR
jgi:hypothetical protein